MLPYQKILAELLLITQLIAFIAGLVFFSKLKPAYWKWFVVYLGLIFSLELFSKYGLEYFPSIRQYYYGFFVIPLQFLFFYWLYSKTTGKYRGLSWLFAIVYLLAFIPEIFFFKGSGWVFYSFSYSVGNLLLAILAVAEFIRQIKSDSILSFNRSRWFYINTGVMLFYIGTLPFFAFYGLFVKELEVWRIYYTVFIVFNHLMYLLFSAAFIWAK